MLSKFILALCLPAVFCASSALAAAPMFAQECTFEWQIRARGIAVGTSTDVVRWGTSSGVSVVSHFVPNAVAAVLGAPKMERRWASSSLGVQREETKTKGKMEHERVQWTTKTGTGVLWQTVGSGEPQEHPAPTGAVRFIDSTVFPYLELVGLPLESGSALWVLNRQAPYPAAARRTQDTLEYTADNKRGTVWISTGKPTKLAFTEGRDSFEATVVSTQCKP